MSGRFMSPNSFSRLALGIAVAAAVGCSPTKDTKNIVKAPTLGEQTLLSNAMDSYDHGLYSVSKDSWTELRDGYPASWFGTLAELKAADTQFYTKDYPAAQIAYEEFAKMHPGHEAIPYVRFQIANCNLEQYRGSKRDQAPLHAAIKMFNQVLEEHPDTEYALLARRKLVECRELLAEYELFVAQFYTKRGQDEAAHARLRTLAINYPGSKALIYAREVYGDKFPTDIPVEVTANDPAVLAQPKTGSPAAKPKSPQLVGSHQEITAPYETRLAKIAPPPVPKVTVTDLVTPSASSSSASSAAPELSAENATPLIGLGECSEQEGGAIFSSPLSQPLTIVETKQLSPSESVIRLSAGQKVSPTFQPEEAKCENAQLSLTIERPAQMAKNSAGTEIYEAHIKSSSPISVAPMIIDRPYRLVVAVNFAN